MPTTLSYPGVYIEEIPSGVRTITGVATSITAFVGRALRGPDNQATLITNFGDYERTFGGLWNESSMSFAVRDFFLNGGSLAVIVRLFKDDADNTTSSKASVAAGGLTFTAADKGAWGANLRVEIDTKNVSEDVALRLGLTKNDLFNLTVRDTSPGGRTERFLNLSVAESARRVSRVLEAESRLIRWTPPNPLPPIAEGKDPISVKDEALDTALKAVPQVPGDIQSARNALQTEINNARAKLTDGGSITISEILPAQGQDNKKGLYALEQTDLFNILCIPPYNSGSVDLTVVANAAAYCERRRAFLIVDPPPDWADAQTVKNNLSGTTDTVGTRSRNAAIFFPRIMQPNPLHNNQIEEFAPCGVIAGVFARTDAQRGVWKAPAGLDATLVGVPQLKVNLTDQENGLLNPLGVNCLRAFPVVGRVVWGARTLSGADQLADEYKYIPVRRLALYIEESLYRGLQWVVFEPNDEPLWSQIRLNAGAFMQNLFRQGAFQGTSPREAYFVKCDKETTTQNDINQGIVNVVIGFAPLKPAEFVVVKIQQIAGQIQV